MEFLEPELQTTYEKCKYTVKIWEHKFQKKYKRVPSKLDIKEASRDVRNAYRIYFKLKTAILEQSFKGVEGFEDLEDDGEPDKSFQVKTQMSINSNEIFKDEPEPKSISDVSGDNIATTEAKIDVWGPHLNNTKVQNDVEEKEEKPTLNLNITKKLFFGSKFSKRNPRKSLSHSQKCKNITSDKLTLSQPTSSFASFSSEEAISFLHDENSDSFMKVSHSIGTLSQPVIQTFCDNNAKHLKIVDHDWLKRVVQVTGPSQESSDFVTSNSGKESYIEYTKLDHDSDDIIENSDEEDSYKIIPSLHVAKKRKIQNKAEVKTDRINDIIDTNKNGVGILYENLIGKDIFDTVENNRTNIGIEVNNDIIDTIEERLKITSVETKNVQREAEVLKESTKQMYIEIEKIKETSDKRLNLESKNQKMNEPNNVTTKKNKKLTKDTKIEDVPKNNKMSKQSNKLDTKMPRKLQTNKKTPKENIQTPLLISQRRSPRKNKNNASVQEFSSDEEDAFHTDTDEKDPEFQICNDKKKRNQFQISSSEDEITPKKSPNLTSKMKSGLTFTNKRGRKKKMVEVDSSQNEQTERYDLEFSIKPRIVASRYGSIKNILRENKILTKEETSDLIDSTVVKEKSEVVKNKRQQAKEKLEQKISSGNLNDNYVRINIKKKVFVRGRSGKNFSKYKKAQWKKAKALAGPNMDMGGCDGGMLTCFTCGQTGHFAQNCKATKGDALLALNAEEEEEECPFPTLEEASRMAQKGNLNVRIPKMALKETQNPDNTEKIDENKSDIFVDEFDSEQLLLETIKLEEHVKKLDVQMYIDNITVVEPYFKCNDDGSILDTPPEVYETLKKFGHTSFRPGQEEAVMRILSGKSTLVTLSTGSGKSLCYQLPAYLYSQREPCISLVISPLVSLMDDQIMGIAKFMKAACLHSNQTAAQKKKILEAISLGELSILLVSPEAVVSGEKQRGFSSFLRKLPPIAFACIDEAHCVSQWSHNFRPSYLMICRVLRQSLGVKTILGLTATATKATQSSIIEHLQIPDGEKGVISDIPLPDNLQLSVSKDINRDHALLALLLSDRFKDCNSIIIYCTRRQECERIAGFLRTSLKSERPTDEENKKRKRVNLQAEPYHAGLSATRRRTIQKSFMSGSLRIVVATVAFGMGINKSDIRAVIHYNMPSSFESYVQEVGRAGRDGLQAQCHVFLDSKGGDENELRRHIYANSIDHHVIRKLLERIFIPCSCKGECPKHEVAFSIKSTVEALDIPEENISTLLCYLELHENRYIELLSPAYTKCKVVSYSGPLQIRKVAKDCPPLAMALALHKSKKGGDANILEFPIVDVAAAMGWESGICKYKLKNLEWTTVNNQPKRSSINVEFSDLGFRLLAPGNLTGEQLDEALESLYSRVVNQERTALLQLNAIHQTFLQVNKMSFKACLSDENEDHIKTKVREYFNSPDPLKLVPKIEYPQINENQLIADIRALILMYRENNFTGRAVARIFQGIQSPNYPAVVWGRCKFWRKHLDKDFHAIAKIATKEIVRLR